MILVARLYNLFFYRPYLKIKLKSCGANFKIGHRSEVYNAKYFSFGSNFFAGPYSYFVTNSNNPVEVGDFVMFGPFCKIIGGNHNTKYTDNHLYFCKDTSHTKSTIKVENGCWVGASATLLSGCHIGEGAVIGANSLVNKYIPPYTIATGSPIKKIYPRFDSKIELENVLRNTNSKYQVDDILKIYSNNNIQFNL